MEPSTWLVSIATRAEAAPSAAARETGPVLVAVLGSSAILASSVYFVHGLNWTASSALVATIAAAIVTLGLAMGFSSLARLTGLGAEEGVYIMQAAQQSGIDLNLRGLLIAGILIGSLGA
ncbi:MAG: YibE/F family protein, partial [Terricaulis sp.]